MAFIHGVECPDFTLHMTLPSVDERRRFERIKMGAECGLIGPSLHYQQSSSVRIGHCGVIKDVSGTLSCSKGKNLEICNKIIKIAPIILYVPSFS